MKSLESDNKKSAEKAPEVKEEVKEEVIDFSKVEIEPMFKDFVDFDSFSKCDFRAVKVKACEAVKKSKKLLQFTLDDGTGTDRTILPLLCRILKTAARYLQSHWQKQRV